MRVDAEVAQSCQGYRKQIAHKPCWEYGYKNTGPSLTTSNSNNKSHWCGLNWTVAENEKMSAHRTWQTTCASFSTLVLQDFDQLLQIVKINCSCGNRCFCSSMRKQPILRCYTMSQENSQNSKPIDNVLCVLNCEQIAKCHFNCWLKYFQDSTEMP